MLPQLMFIENSQKTPHFSGEMNGFKKILDF